MFMPDSPQQSARRSRYMASAASCRERWRQRRERPWALSEFGSPGGAL